MSTAHLQVYPALPLVAGAALAAAAAPAAAARRRPERNQKKFTYLITTTASFQTPQLDMCSCQQAATGQHWVDLCRGKRGQRSSNTPHLYISPEIWENKSAKNNCCIYEAVAPPPVDWCSPLATARFSEEQLRRRWTRLQPLKKWDNLRSDSAVV